MALRKKPLTPEEFSKQQKQQEDDLARYQREYRLLEKDRALYRNSNTSHLTKLKKVLNILRHEYWEVLTDLSVASSEANTRKDNYIVQQIEKLLQEYKIRKMEIKDQKAYIREMDIQISLAKKQVINLSAKQVTDIQMQDRILNGQKILEALENKLEVATRRFCTVQWDNKLKRQEIHHQLTARAFFNKSWEKAIKWLAQGKKCMLDLIEQATIAYDQREEWTTKLNMLRMRTANEYVMNSQEVLEMARQIDNETKQQDFLRTKSQKRIMTDLVEREMAKRDKQRQRMSQTLTMYQDIISRIQAFTGATTVQQMCSTFVEHEAQNFAAFEYMNNLNQSIEHYSVNLQQVLGEIDKQRLLNNKRERRQFEKLDLLREEAKQANDEADAEKMKLDDIEKDLAKVLSGVERLFNTCHCSTSPFIQLLGDNSKISMYNAILYLEVLEGTVSESIRHLYYKERVVEKKRRRDQVVNDNPLQHTIALVNQLVPTSPCPLCIEQEIVNDVVDTLQFALNRSGVEKLCAEQLQYGDVDDPHVHRVSNCHLPASREIVQRRYQ